MILKEIIPANFWVTPHNLQHIFQDISPRILPRVLPMSSQGSHPRIARIPPCFFLNILLQISLAIASVIISGIPARILLETPAVIPMRLLQLLFLGSLLYSSWNSPEKGFFRIYWVPEKSLREDPEVIPRRIPGGICEGILAKLPVQFLIHCVGFPVGIWKEINAGCSNGGIRARIQAGFLAEFPIGILWGIDGRVIWIMH